MMRKGDSVISAVTDSTLGYLLDFFHAEGMLVSVGDLFTVTNEPEPPKSAN